MVAGPRPNPREFFGFRIIASFVLAVLPGVQQQQQGFVTNNWYRGPRRFVHVMA